MEVVFLILCVGSRQSAEARSLAHAAPQFLVAEGVASQGDQLDMEAVCTSCVIESLGF